VPGIIDSFKQGYTGDETQHVSVAGVQVRCPHCGGEDFEDRHALVPTRGMTFLGLAFVNRAASVLVCAKCGHMEWFLEDTGSE
jgi:predicted nucleic-acid-binding Zn-ribbon protein